MTNVMTNIVAEVTNMAQTVDSINPELTPIAINTLNELAANRIPILVVVAVIAAILIFKK